MEHFYIYLGFDKLTLKFALQIITDKITDELKKKINVLPMRNASQICICKNTIEEAIETYFQEEKIVITLLGKSLPVFLNENFYKNL